MRVNSAHNILNMKERYLPGQHERANWMRLDSARILKRFFFCEQSLILAQGGWIAGVPLLDAKVTLPKHLWEDSLTADELRKRVFELRFPSREMIVGDDAPITALFDQAIHAPGPEAFVLALAQVFKPAFLDVYRRYLDHADEIAEGPTIRFMRAAIADKTRQIGELNALAETLLAHNPASRHQAEAWVRTLTHALEQTGGLTVETPKPAPAAFPLPGSRTFKLAEVPARDSRFDLQRFYWPDQIDPTFSYGEGVRLQLRSAVSHINEVWAVETAGAILQAFAERLGWEFVFDAARWGYDESRHCRMGYERLLHWGFAPSEIPLGTYIFDSAFGQDPVYRMGMLFYFETKNIGKKPQRTQAFASYHDAVSQHDMDFDWADETIHAGYGARWLGELNTQTPGYADSDAIRLRCDALVKQVVDAATDTDKTRVRTSAEAMIAKAETLALAAAATA